MKLRYARHTNKINALIEFYTKIIGLEQLGEFENHSGYNGVFLGLPNLDWHLEFTESTEKVNHHPDEDDLIVLYLDSIDELTAKVHLAKEQGYFPKNSKNPYWQKNGVELIDPDGFGVLLTVNNSSL